MVRKFVKNSVNAKHKMEISNDGYCSSDSSYIYHTFYNNSSGHGGY